MQNVLLGAFALKVGDAGYVSILYFAQLGPLLFLSQIGGVIADQVNRRRFLVTMQSLQMLLSFGLAGLVAVDHPDKTWIFLCVARDRHRQRAERARPWARSCRRSYHARTFRARCRCSRCR